MSPPLAPCPACVVMVAVLHREAVGRGDINVACVAGAGAAG